MHAGAQKRVGWHTVGRIGLALALLALLAGPADARTRRHRRPSALAVALQPFLLVHSAVHAVAAPIVYHAPRVILGAATAPIRMAYRSSRAQPDDFEDPEDAEADDGDQPMRVAYVTARPRTDAPPRAEPVEEGDETPELGRDRDEEEASPMVSGDRAILRNGIAEAPAHAPQSVKNAIWAANSLRRKPYVWGGGHGSFNDRGYDCSGTVSFALHGAGALSAPLPSSELMRYGERGRGRWITIYSRPGHTFAVIAGLRLDTTDFQNGGNTGPRWHADMRDTGGYVARHPAQM